MRFPRVRFPAFFLKAGLRIGLMMRTVTELIQVKSSARAFVLSTYLVVLSACTAPAIAPTPSVVILSEDLNFKWVPPNLGHEMKVFISAGRYLRTDNEWDTVYYESETGLVSRAYPGQPAEKIKGGIGSLKRQGRYFVWEFAPSITAQTAWGLISGQTQEGPLVRIYLGKVPQENEPSLQFEK